MTRTRVAYIMSRFPRLTETFILAEILAVEEQGVDVVLFPLLRERSTLVQPEAVPLVAAARYQPFLSAAIAWSNVRTMVLSPRRYLSTLAAVLRATWRSPNFLLGGIGIFPKTVHNARVMEREGIQHVHCHFANHPALAGLIINRLVGIPYSFTAHGSDLHKDRTGLPAKVERAAFVAAISEYNRRLILDECRGAHAEKVRVIHCGVRTDRFTPQARTIRSTGDPLSILCVGTLHEVKGQSYLVDACRILRDRGVRVACRFVGEGEDRAKLEHLIATSGLRDTVQLLGARTQVELRELLAESDVLVAPSVPTASGKREGIPVVLMEAMSSGIPVIASDLSGIPELVVDGKSGLLVRPGDAESIADALARVAVDADLREQLAARGRDRVLAEFDIRANARLLARLYAASGSAP